MRHYPLLVASMVLCACADHVTAPAPAAVSPEPRLTVAAPAAELPNVVRFGDQFVFLIQDPNTDLIAFAGLPDDLNALCAGGPVSFAAVDVQLVGVQQEIIKALIKGNDANLDVWRLSTFEDICVSTPLAHGTGSIMFHSNDLLDAGTHAVSGFHMDGIVSLATGGTAHLLAHNLFQTLPNGTTRRVFRQVILSGA